MKPQWIWSKGEPASSAESAVSPNATLQITLELVSWKTVMDITEDQKVIKKILKEGEGYERPNDGATVKVKLIGQLQDGTVFFKKGHDDGEELFESKTNDELVIDGLDRVVMTMKKGEVAMLTIAPEYAYGYYLPLGINFFAPMSRYATNTILLFEVGKWVRMSL